MKTTPLNAELALGRPVHAYLLTGPDAGRLAAAAVQIAQALNCVRAGPDAPCGTCRACDEIGRGVYPDFSGGEARLKLGEVKAQLALLAERPVVGRRRVVVLDRAPEMTREAQNALLKRLEEPPSGSVLILTAPSVLGLAPTIVSRCRHLAIGGAAWPEIVAELGAAGVPGPARGFAALMAGADLALARSLADLDDLAALRADAVGFLAGLAGPEAAPPLELVEAYGHRLGGGEATQTWLLAMGAVLRAVIAAASGEARYAEEAFAAGEFDRLTAIGAGAAARISDAVAAVRAAVARRAAARLALEAALLGLDLS